MEKNTSKSCTQRNIPLNILQQMIYEVISGIFQKLLLNKLPIIPGTFHEIFNLNQLLWFYKIFYRIVLEYTAD